MSESCRNTARGKQGPAGDASYVYFSYATNSVGAGFSLTPSASLKYVQWIVSSAPIPTPVIGNFPGTWFKYIGDDGADGADGALWYSGSGAPSGGLGVVNDFYLNAANGDYYKKTGVSTWTSQGNIKGDDGANGAIGFEYVFSNSTSSSDPGTGNLRFNNADVTLASQIFISENIPVGNNISNVFGLLNVPTSAVKGRIVITEKDNLNNFAVFDCTLLAAGSPTWFIISVNYISASATAPFSNSDRVIFSFNLTGDKGDAGTDSTEIVLNNLTSANSTGAGMAVLRTGSIPASTLTVNGDVVKIQTVSQNMNADAALADFETIAVELVQGAGTWNLGNYLFNFSTDTFVTTAELSRISSTTALLTRYLVGSASGYTTEVLTGLDYTLSFTINMTTAESVVSGSAPFIVARQLYIQKIAI